MARSLKPLSPRPPVSNATQAFQSAAAADGAVAAGASWPALAVSRGAVAGAVVAAVPPRTGREDEDGRCRAERDQPA